MNDLWKFNMSLVSPVASHSPALSLHLYQSATRQAFQPKLECAALVSRRSQECVLGHNETTA